MLQIHATETTLLPSQPKKLCGVQPRPNKPFGVPELIRRILLSWLFAVTVEFLLVPAEARALDGTDALTCMSLVRVTVVTCVGTALLFMLSRIRQTEKAERWGLAGAFIALSTLSLCVSFTWPFFFACGLITVGTVLFAIYGWKHTSRSTRRSKAEYPSHRRVTAALSLLFFLFVSLWTAGKVYTFSSPTYDFGIFSQMFYNMKESGLPMTTVERDGLLSHFYVHVSPIYYLMLPFYCLFPYPVTLQVLQAAVMTSAVLPLWRIGTRHGLSGAQKMLVCTLLLLYPAFSGGASYDIHENCFLAPLILWLLWGIDEKRVGVAAMAAALTLLVKEDAAVYVAVIALWLIVKTVLRWNAKVRGDLFMGIGLLSVSLLYFFFVTKFLSGIGDGVMSWRYSNFLYGGSTSLLTVVKAVLLHPMKALYECMDREKTAFLLQTLLPFLGLPLLTRRYERYILLIPYVLVNLMPDYVYQHSIFFQYTFGSSACLFYLVVLNLSDLKIDGKRVLTLLTAVAVCAGFFGSLVVPKALRYPRDAILNLAHYEDIRDTLDRIPAEASVSATTFLTAYLSQRDTLYDIGYASREHLLATEYIAIDVSADLKKYATETESGFENLTKILQHHGYALYAEIPEKLVIYHKPKSDP